MLAIHSEHRVSAQSILCLLRLNICRNYLISPVKATLVTFTRAAALNHTKIIMNQKFADHSAKNKMNIIKIESSSDQYKKQMLLYKMFIHAKMNVCSEFGSLTFTWPSDHKKLWSSGLFGPDQFNYSKPQDQVTRVLPGKWFQPNRYKHSSEALTFDRASQIVDPRMSHRKTLFADPVTLVKTSRYFFEYSHAFDQDYH